MTTKSKILQAHSVISIVINSSNLWSNNRSEAETAAALLRDTALKNIPEIPILWVKLTEETAPKDSILVVTTNYNFADLATGFVKSHMTSKGVEYGLYDYQGEFLCDAVYFILASDLLKLNFLNNSI